MKTLTAIFTFLILTATSAMACDGFYMGLRGGIANHNIGETGASSTERFKVDDNILMLSGALGYRYGHYRAELEYIWRKDGEVTERSSSTEFESESYMLNAYYDLTPYSRFTPFINAGLGVSNLTATYRPVGFATETTEKTNFTWSVGGGVSAKLSNRWNLDVGYRYYNMGKLDKASVRNHEVYGGARYIF